MLKTQKGITLVALVITIIVLLILAGVSITLALDPNNGLFRRAQQAADATVNGTNNELTAINDATTIMDNIISNYAL